MSLKKWELIAKGKTLVGVDTNDTDFNTVEKTGGSKFLQKHSHNLLRHGAWGETSSHTGMLYEHGANDFEVLSTTESGTGNSGNLQPYITCYIWQRIN